MFKETIFTNDINITLSESTTSGDFTSMFESTEFIEESTFVINLSTLTSGDFTSMFYHAENDGTIRLNLSGLSLNNRNDITFSIRD